MIARALRVTFVCGAVAAVAVPACGNTSDSGPGGSAGTAGTSGGAGKVSSAGSAGREVGGSGGAASSTQPVACGTKSCAPVVITFGTGLTIPACCSDAATNHCGLDSSFLTMYGPSFTDVCQPLAQPGSLNADCPKSPKTPVQGTTSSIQFDGCCRPAGTCGYMLDTIGGFIPLGLGCVDSSPFLEGGAPASCAYTGGASGGGAASTGEGGAAGAPSAGGAAGS